ncbi:MAG: hypothetical protein AAGN66_28335, partial [Acidobacteriota bacterium]
MSVPPLNAVGRIVTAASAEARLGSARAWLGPRAEEGALVVAASRGAADDFLLDLSAGGRGVFGLHRRTLPQLAAELSIHRLAESGRAPVAGLGLEALAARAIAAALTADELSYLSPVAEAPGMERALAR